jgi:hypothetical protein
VSPFKIGDEVILDDFLLSNGRSVQFGKIVELNPRSVFPYAIIIQGEPHTYHCTESYLIPVIALAKLLLLEDAQ